MNAAFRGEVANWLRDLRRRTNLSYDKIAAQAGVSPSTLYRWIDPNRMDSPSHSTLLSLSEAFGVTIPGHKPLARPTGGLAEHGVARYEPPDQELPQNVNQSWWRIKDRSLELAGFLPGDRVLLDQSVEPKRGNAVVAQIYDMEAAAAETVIRIHAFPALVTKSADPLFADRADIIDNARVKVMGTIVRLVRDLDG